LSLAAAGGCGFDWLASAGTIGAGEGETLEMLMAEILCAPTLTGFLQCLVK
jgi:hypothetical protein